VASTTIEHAHDFGDTVYRKNARERDAGIVTGLVLSVNGSLTYRIAWEDGHDGFHFEIELTDQYVEDYARVDA
jgi:hypothetical protein